ncbi:hypothetical protein PoB_001110200 [Plakobranchus ocellatus]|uniref:Uncharacterized protein n=1 Tax=Plakobranchus ocellatus TaxID=259542 RepID=A0AAV3YQ62_9GAST|nr:hypothetical protein PoB_001110200 [Plakobranchus ocellatus]
MDTNFGSGHFVSGVGFRQSETTRVDSPESWKSERYSVGFIGKEKATVYKKVVSGFQALHQKPRQKSPGRSHGGSAVHCATNAPACLVYSIGSV